MTDNKKIGEVQIANEVVASIAGISASEVEGVDSMAGGITNEIAGRLGMKNPAKGVKVEVKRGYGSSRSCHLFEVWIQYS